MDVLGLEFTAGQSPTIRLLRTTASLLRGAMGIAIAVVVGYLGM